MSTARLSLTSHRGQCSSAAVSDENQSVRGLSIAPRCLSREVCPSDAKQPNEARGPTGARMSGCLQPLYSNDVVSGANGSFHRSISTDSDMSSDADFDLRSLIKDELRSNIHKRRWQSGMLDWALEDYDKERNEDNQMTPEEIQKREDRKMRNREAAARCREKRRRHVEQLEETMDSLECRREELVRQKENLSLEKQQLQQMVEEHLRLCPRGRESVRGT